MMWCILDPAGAAPPSFYCVMCGAAHVAQVDCIGRDMDIARQVQCPHVERSVPAELPRLTPMR